MAGDPGLSSVSAGLDRSGAEHNYQWPRGLLELRRKKLQRFSRQIQRHRESRSVEADSVRGREARLRAGDQTRWTIR